MRWAGLGGEVGGGLLLMGSKIRSTLFSSRALLGDFYWGRAGGVKLGTQESVRLLFAAA